MLAAALLASAVPAAAQVCGDSYLMQDSPTFLIRLDTSTNPFTPATLGGAGFLYNAMGYRPADDSLYAIRGGTNHLLRIGISGAATDLGAVSGLPVPGSANYHVGAFANDGLMYVRRNNNNTTLYAIDIDARTATAVPLSADLTVADLAWFNNRFWGVATSTNHLMSVTTTGTVEDHGATGAPSAAFGAMLSASNGIFGVNNNGFGAFQFDPASGQATLISAAPGSGNNDGARCLTAAMVFNADLSITKDDGSATYLPGTNVVYQIVVSNNGPFGVQNAQVNDPLPSGITTASWTCTAASGGACGAASGSGALADTPDLPVGGTVTYALTLAVPVERTGNLSNQATITLPSGFVDPTPGNNSATDVDTSAGRPGIAIAKSGSGPDPLTTGAVVTYTFLVSNTGNLPLTNIAVADPLSGLSAIACPATTLAAGASFTCTATYTVTQQDVNKGFIENTATVTADPPGGAPPVSGTDTAVVPPSQEPGLSLKKTAAGPIPLTLNSVVTYEFAVANTGNVPLTNVVVSDPHPGLSPISCPTTTLLPGATMLCTATYSVTQADVNAGVVQNTATVTGMPPNGAAPPTATSTTSYPPVAPVPVMPPAWLAVLALTLALGAIWRLRRRQRA
jgi:uncharacterized repeat protein (TIGR01451 family)